MHSLEEKNELLQRLDNARESLIAAVSGLSESQATFKPSPEAWSVAGIVEHLASVEDFVVMRVEKIASEPDDGNFKDSDVVLFDKVVDRSAKFQAPERAHPTGKPLASSLERLVATRAKIVELIRSAGMAIFGSTRCIIRSSAPWMDISGWLRRPGTAHGIHSRSLKRRRR